MSRLDQLTRMLEAEPDDGFLNYALAMELSKLGRVEDALARFDRVIQINRDECAAYHHKGNLLIQIGRTGDARAVLQRGIDAAQRCGNGHAQSEMIELLESIK